MRLDEATNFGSALLFDRVASVASGLVGSLVRNQAFEREPAFFNYDLALL
jgi:hypothetical protein